MQTDAELVKAVLDGEKHIFAELVKHYERPVALEILGDYHLAFTQKETEKGKRWYEWSLYVPDKEPPPLSVVLNYRIHCRLNVNRTKNIGNSIKQVSISKPKKIETAEDFDKWILGAMAELSDDGKALEGVTYKSVLKLTRQIREFPAK